MANDPVEFNDFGLQLIAKELRKAKNLVVDIGIQGADASAKAVDSKGKKSGATVVQIAAFNEFGAKHIPERSFIRSTTNEQQARLKGINAASFKRVLNQQSDVVTELNKMGAFMQGAIQKKITDLKTPPNAPATIKRKKSDNPLIDTGQNLRSRISYKVKDKRTS